MVNVSVIIPAHNPRGDYLERVLEAMRAQSLPLAEWELVLLDNASRRPLVEWVDLSWHPQGRIVREETLGLTAARLRGIAETGGGLLVFVDDDNVLSPDYLETAVTVFQENPFLGVFGGRVAPVFDAPPPRWTRPYWPRLAIRPVSISLWSNDPDHWESTPCGAGLCVRREVADLYRRQVGACPLRLLLGRSGARLVSGEDDDIALTACSAGFGKGLFKELALSHLIPPSRLTKAYLCRMFEGNGYSSVILNAIWCRVDASAAYAGTGNLVRMGLRRLVSDWRGRRFMAAQRRGEKAARAVLSDMESVRAVDPPPTSRSGSASGGALERQ